MPTLGQARSHYRSQVQFNRTASTPFLRSIKTAASTQASKDQARRFHGEAAMSKLTSRAAARVLRERSKKRR